MNRLPEWDVLRAAAPEHVSPPPQLLAKDSRKDAVAHRAFRLACACGHTTDRKSVV